MREDPGMVSRERRKKPSGTNGSLKVAALVAALILLASGCGISAQGARVDDDSGYRDDDTVEIQRDAFTQRSDPSDGDEDARRGSRLPADFPVPVPEDYEVRSVETSENETSVVLRTSSGEDAYNYYRQALAQAGFEVVDQGRNQSGLFDAELEFSSSDIEGNMEFEGDLVEVDVERFT